MAWYRVGTVSVTSGSPAVVGSGTSWLDNAQAGDGFRGPDGRVYEILSVDSDTAITLAENYLGSNAAGAAYGIFATQARIVSLAQQVAQLLADYSSIATNAGQGKFTDGTVAAPGMRFAADLDSGFYRIGSNTIGLSLGGALRFMGDASGRFGIGTTPVASGANAMDLQIGNPAASAGSGITLGATTTSDIAFADGVSGTGQYAGLIRYSHASDYMALWASSAERMRVLGTGQVLIGRTADSGLGPLQVSDSAGALGDFVSDSASTALLRVRNTGAQTVGVAVQNSWTGTDGASGLQLLVDGAGTAYVSQREAQPLALQTDGTTRISVTGTGDVGVGTATPNKLAVTRALTVNGSANSAFELAAGDVSCGWLFGSPSRVTLETNGAIPLTVNVNGAEAYRVDTSRNLLIGTTTAAQRLTVGGSARVLGGNFELDTGMVTSNSGANPLRFGVNNIPLMSLDAAGNFIQSAPAAPPVLGANGTLVLNLTSNTNLRISARGSDGVTRVANIALA